MAEESIGGIPLEIVAAITAVLATVLETAPDRLVVRSIVPAEPAAPAPQPSPWALAARLDLHLSRTRAVLRPR